MSEENDVVEEGVETAAVVEEAAVESEEERKAAIRREFASTNARNTARKQALKEAHLK